MKAWKPERESSQQRRDTISEGVLPQKQRVHMKAWKPERESSQQRRDTISEGVRGRPKVRAGAWRELYSILTHFIFIL